MSNKDNQLHAENRISASRRAFYSLQGAGLGNLKSNPNAIAYLWNAALRPVLTYGLNCMFLSKSSMSKLEKTQSSLIKASLGLHKFCRSSPILSALDISSISHTVDMASLGLLKQIFDNSSGAKHFYMHMVQLHSSGMLHGHSDLVSRCLQICSKYDISLLKFLLVDKYESETCLSLIHISEPTRPY